MTLAVFLDGFDRVLPPIHLSRIQFAQMQHGALHDAGAVHAQTFVERVVHVALAILVAAVGFQKHARSLANSPRTVYGVGLHTSPENASTCEFVRESQQKIFRRRPLNKKMRQSG